MSKKSGLIVTLFTWIRVGLTQIRIRIRPHLKPDPIQTPGTANPVHASIYLSHVLNVQEVMTHFYEVRLLGRMIAKNVFQA